LHAISSKSATFVDDGRRVFDVDDTFVAAIAVRGGANGSP
jgi:hypothetical protein